MKLDESTARRQLKSPWSLSGRWSWSWMTYYHTLCAMSISTMSIPFWDTAISKFDHKNPWSRSCVWSKVKVTFDLQISKVKIMGQGQTHLSHLRPGVQSICSLFISWQSDHIGWDIGNSIFDLENPRSGSWPRSNLMVTSEALKFKRYVCFSFRGNRTIFGWNIANSIFDLENSRSRSWPRSNPMVTFEL